MRVIFFVSLVLSFLLSCEEKYRFEEEKVTDPLYMLIGCLDIDRSGYIEEIYRGVIGRDESFKGQADINFDSKIDDLEARYFLSRFKDTKEVVKNKYALEPSERIYLLNEFKNKQEALVSSTNISEENRNWALKELTLHFADLRYFEEAILCAENIADYAYRASALKSVSLRMIRSEENKEIVTAILDKSLMYLSQSDNIYAHKRLSQSIEKAMIENRIRKDERLKIFGKYSLTNYIVIR